MDGSSETQDAAPTQESHASGSRCRPVVGERNSRIIVPKRPSHRISCRYDENFYEDLDDPACGGDTPGIPLRPVPNYELVRPVQLQTMWHGTPSECRTDDGYQPAPHTTWGTGGSPDECPADQTGGTSRDLPSRCSGHAQSRRAPERDRASSCSGARSPAALVGSESFIKS